MQDIASGGMALVGTFFIKIDFATFFSMQVVVEESQKTENVDLALMLIQSQRCSALIEQLSQTEVDFAYKVN